MQFKIVLLAIIGLLLTNVAVAQLVPLELKDTLFTNDMDSESKKDSKNLLYQEDAPDYRVSDGQGGSPQSLFDHLPKDPTLSTFMDILMQVDDVLQLVNDPYTEPKFTLFAPTNSAFQRYMSDSAKRASLDEEDGFKNFLLCHIVPEGKYSVKDLEKAKSLNTAKAGRKISVENHWIFGITLDNTAKVDKDSIEAVNGIAYKIDHVLEPAR